MDISSSACWEVEIAHKKCTARKVVLLLLEEVKRLDVHPRLELGLVGGLFNKLLEDVAADLRLSFQEWVLHDLDNGQLLGIG